MRTMRSQGRARRVVGATILAALGVAGVGLVAGCSGGGSSSASSSGENGPAAAAPRAAAGSGNTSAGSGSGSASTATSTTNVAETGDLIITAALQLAAKSPNQAAVQAEQTVISAGGYVAAEAEGVGPQSLPSANASADDTESADTGVSPMTLPAVNGAPKSEQALLVLRVPPAHLDAVLTALAGTGTVSYRTLSETNVTGQVADVASRITSAQDSLTELRGMIDKAASMNDLISLENALSTRESDLESLEAQQRALSDQIQYATVTLGYFVPAAPSTTPAKPATHHSGFVAGLVDGWHAFLATLRVLLALLGWLLPFAIVIALLWWPIRKLLRRRDLAAEGADRDAVTHTWWRRRPAEPAE
jgi:Domain of unknown function (DUF4349)